MSTGRQFRRTSRPQRDVLRALRVAVQKHGGPVEARRLHVHGGAESRLWALADLGFVEMTLGEAQERRDLLGRVYQSHPQLWAPTPAGEQLLDDVGDDPPPPPAALRDDQVALLGALAKGCERSTVGAVSATWIVSRLDGSPSSGSVGTRLSALSGRGLVVKIDGDNLYAKARWAITDRGLAELARLSRVAQ